MMRVMIAAGVVWVIVLGGAIGHAEASTPTPIASSPTPAQVNVTFEGVTFTWPKVAGATNYRLTGSVFAVRGNAADPSCSPPLVVDSRRVPIDVTLPGTALSYAVPLPSLPPEDAWFTATMEIRIEATDEHGVLLAAGKTGRIAETQCANPPPLPLPSDEMIARCVPGPDATESTSDAARAHGQRTFDYPTGGTRVYVGLGESWSCISLSGIPPLPEFAPDAIDASPGVSAGDPPSIAGIRLPQTGSGQSHSNTRLLLVTLGAAAGLACAGTLCARRIRRVTRG